jgi:hypothetical protein
LPFTRWEYPFRQKSHFPFVESGFRITIIQCLQIFVAPQRYLSGE